MIQSRTVHSVLPLASYIADLGKTVRATDQSILSELCANTGSGFAYPTDMTAEGAEFDITGIASVISGSTSGINGEASLHDQSLESIVTSISGYVLSHVSFAKNVVKPVVIEMAEGVQTYLKDFCRPDASAAFNIQICDRPEILSNEFFKDTLKFYEGKASIVPSTAIACKPKLGEELLPLLLMGDQDTDQEITAWFTRQGETFFVDVWNSFFCKGDGVIKTFMNFSNLEEFDSFEQANIVLAVYLFANKIFDQAEELSEGLSLAAYKNIVAETRDWAGVNLLFNANRMAAMEKNRTMVLSQNDSTKTIRVFGDVYRQWLEQGGVPEIILGLMVSGISINNEFTINERRVELLDAWKSYRVYYNAAEANKSFDYFKDALRVKFAEVCGHFSEEENAFINQTTGYHENLKKYFEEELLKLTTGSMNEIFETCLKLVCRARFYYTDSENILTDILTITKDLPNADVREAALIAVINYVADYISDQLVLVDF